MGFTDHLMVNEANFLLVLSKCRPVFGFWPLEEDTLTHLAAFIKGPSAAISHRRPLLFFKAS